MATKDIGNHGEDLASTYLEERGFLIVERNWRTRWCEIDIVAKKQNTIYFVEVKTRKSNTYGDGLDYITPKKLQQMNFAAEFWLAAHKWSGNSELAAISVITNNGEITFTEV